MTQDNNPHHNAAHLAHFTTHIPRPLTLFAPTIYRYIPQQYVDSYFTTGGLMLSCLANFRKHANEQQGDVNEGHSMVMINDREADRHIGAFISTNSNAYVMSFTSKTKDMSSEFGDGCIEIFDPTTFCAMVANEIPGCTHAMMGPCIYVDQRLLISRKPAPKEADLRDDADPQAFSLDKFLQQTDTISGPKQYFLKDRKYEDQFEFRMIWETNKPVDSSLLVKLPLNQILTFSQRIAH